MAPNACLSLKERHRTMMRLQVTGLALKEAAKAVGYSMTRASAVANSPLYQEELTKLRGEIESRLVKTEGDIGLTLRKQLETEGKPSIEKIVHLRDYSGKDHVQLSAAKDILDRLGIRAPEQLDIRQQMVGSDGLENMLKTAIKEMRNESEKEESIYLQPIQGHLPGDSPEEPNPSEGFVQKSDAGRV